MASDLDGYDEVTVERVFRFHNRHEPIIRAVVPLVFLSSRRVEDVGDFEIVHVVSSAEAADAALSGWDLPRISTSSTLREIPGSGGTE